jgi:hypothetical protein
VQPKCASAAPAAPRFPPFRDECVTRHGCCLRASGCAPNQFVVCCSHLTCGRHRAAMIQRQWLLLQAQAWSRVLVLWLSCVCVVHAIRALLVRSSRVDYGTFCVPVYVRSYAAAPTMGAQGSFPLAALRCACAAALHNMCSLIYLPSSTSSTHRPSLCTSKGLVRQLQYAHTFA